jgi:nitrogenase subunit NifH
MSRIKLRVVTYAALSALGGAAVWAQAPAKPDAPKPDPGVGAYIGGKPVTLQELDAKALKTDMKLAQSLYDARRAALDQVLMERLLGDDAAAQKITVDELIRKRVAEKSKPVTDADVETYYKANSARMGGKTLEQVSAQIRPFLANQQETDAKNNLLAELKTKAEVKIVLDAPRADVIIAANDPVLGPKDAKVTIVEFSDFQ